MPPIHVFDTYARSQSGRIMHFDVITAEKSQEKAVACAHEWLASIGESDAVINAEHCCYCHSEPEGPDFIQNSIDTVGYAIYKLEGCPT